MKKIAKIKVTRELLAKARFLAIAADPTRMRILIRMFQVKKAMVSEVAEALSMSIAAVSHHLQIMKESGFLESEKKGTSVYYTVLLSPELLALKKFIL
ncbi:MAG: helix-turn-helix transcriptional regulator [Candidatus Harrisonbacteria bacterium]|nr:helix-turn-helix transcriptional regulator [Candidatus Harrisonbacteria bacterium]